MIANLDALAEDAEISRADAVIMALRHGLEKIAEKEGSENEESDDIAECTDCNAAVPEDALFCPQCGVEFDDEPEDESEQSPTVCFKCGKSMKPGWKKCPYCATSLVP